MLDFHYDWNKGKRTILVVENQKSLCYLNNRELKRISRFLRLSCTEIIFIILLLSIQFELKVWMFKNGNNSNDVIIKSLEELP